MPTLQRKSQCPPHTLLFEQEDKGAHMANIEEERKMTKSYQGFCECACVVCEQWLVAVSISVSGAWFVIM